jgi:NAD(P)-dependent dehydrogenase (short-subunit alcohol dehydrogenase family)
MIGPVVVTGSASGMGAATQSLLEAAGCPVIGVDRTDADVVADLATTDGRQFALDEIHRSTAGVVGGVVTFAGVSGFNPVGPPAIASINYFGSVELLDGLRPALVAGGGAAVAISSNSATTSPGIDADLVDACLAGDEEVARARALEIGGLATYAASKLAVARWVRRTSTSASWIGSGVRLNAVAPGFISTPLTDAMAADPEAQRLIDRVPLPIGRPGRPEEVASLVQFLLGDGGAFFVGAVLLLDGGTEALIRPDDWPVGRPSRERA